MATEKKGTVKRLLPNTETEIFYNWNDFPDANVRAVSISLCNTSNASVKVHLSFVELSGLFLAGAIFSNYTLAPYETLYKEIPPRVMASDESIRAYCEVPDVVALSIDLLGVDESLIPSDES